MPSLWPAGTPALAPPALRTIALAVAVLGALGLPGLGYRLASGATPYRAFVPMLSSDQTAATPGLPYADGACQVQPPTSGDNHLAVFLDPGHGGIDPGAPGTTLSGHNIDEKTATLAVATDLSSLLRSDGYTVVMSRTADTSVVQLGPGDVDQGAYTEQGNHNDLLARVQCANQSKSDLLLSIHFNSFADPGVGGVETYYDEVRPFAADNLRLATLVQQDVVAGLAAGGWDIPDRGLMLDSNDTAPAPSPRAAAYHYLLLIGPADAGWLDSPSQVPGVIAEPLFLSDPFEASIAASGPGQQTLAKGFETAIQQYFGLASAANPASAAT